MKAPISRLALSAGVPLLLALSGCVGPESSTSAPSGEMLQAESGLVLFSEEFSDAGKIQIVSDGSGNLGSAFQARIGSEAEKLLTNSLAQPTLAKVYQELKGGTAEVPEAVARASDQIELQKQTSPSEDYTPRTPVPLAKTATSEADFTNRFCRDFREAPITWKKAYCWWVAGYGLNFVIASSGDRVYAYNHSPSIAKLKLVAEYTGETHPWQPTLQPYWVTWFNWGGSFVRAKAYMVLNSGVGELGMTSHRPVYDPPK